MDELDKKARALFEVWLSPSLSQEGSFDADGDFVYNDDWVQGAWIGYRAALTAAPEGYRMVPVKPTSAMIDEGCLALAGSIGGYEAGLVRACWAVMLAAAREVGNG